jgi:uncharacterized membrane protein
MDLPQLTRRLESIESRLATAEADIQALTTTLHPKPRLKPILPPPLPSRPTLPPLPATPLLKPIEDPPAFPVLLPPDLRSPIPQSAIANPQSHISLESRIGKNLAGWIGAIVLVLGVGFFLKYAWQHEWINPSPAARVLMTVLSGLTLAGVGEYLLRKPMRGLAAVLYAAGTAVTMAAFFAASAYFSPPVLNTTAASLLILATAAGGIALALRANLPAVAILSLLGAYLSPVFLRTAADQSATLIPYLLLLAATGWTLCLARPHWHPLRAFTFAASALAYVHWYLHTGRPHDHTSLAFAYVSLLFAGTLAELFLTLQRQFKDTPHATVPFGTRLAKLESSAAVLSLLNTLLTAAALYSLHRASQPLAGTLAIGLAAIQSLVALSTFSKQFRYSAILQSIALVSLAVPLLLNHFAINVAWLVMGVALAILDRRLDLRWARPWAIALWLLAAAKLLTLDLLNPSLRATLLTVGVRPLSTWLLMSWSAAITAHALAFLGRRGVTPDRPGASLASLGTLLFLLATATAWDAGPTLTLAALLWLTPIVGLRQQGGRIAYATHAWTLLLFLTAKWLLLDGLSPTLAAWSGQSANTLPLLNFTGLNAAALVALFAYLSTPTPTRAPKLLPTLAICTITFALANFELCRLVNHLASAQPVRDILIAKQVSLSILWALASLIAIAVGFAKRLPAPRYAALALLAVTLLKVLLIDMAGVETLWRILSFTAVGALLLCVSFVYYNHPAPAAYDE